jgi:hypothetical protein
VTVSVPGKATAVGDRWGKGQRKVAENASPVLKSATEIGGWFTSDSS